MQVNCCHANPSTACAPQTGTLRRWLAHTLMAAGVATLIACGGGSSAPATAPQPATASAVIGPAGGTLVGPDGVQVIVPPAALAQATEIVVSREGSGAPELGGLKLISAIYAVTPHGTEFAESARISIPFNPVDVAPGTQPIVIKSQPGGAWTALVSEVAGTALAADTSGLSYYAVGTCVLSTSVSVPGPDPLLACPSQHSMKLELLDASGLALPALRNSNGLSIPVLTITAPTQLRVRFSYSRPPSNRLDQVTLTTYGATFGAMTPVGWPNNRPLGGPSESPVLAGYQMEDTFVVDPSTVPLASQAGGTKLRFFARVETQVDAFFPGCVCFKPASWGYEAEIAVRVIFAAPPPPPVVTHTVGGSISGLTGAGLVLRNNGADNLAVAANASAFTFPSPVTAGSAYNVTVFAQPAGQTCTVANGSGTANANITNVTVNCIPTFTVGGNVSGLVGTGLVLQNNGGDNLAFTASGAFSFATKLAANTNYAVSVLTQPSGQICTVTNGSGTVTANVSNIVVTCASASGGGLALVANTGADTFSIFRVDAGTGALSTLGTVPAGRSPSAVVISPNGLYAYVGYGVTRSVDSFSINATAGVLTPLGSPVGGVPDKLAMDPLGRFLWGINYGFSTISVLSIASNGVLDLVAPNTVASGNPSAIQAHPSGNFVYVASDTTNALSVYDVNPSTGALTLTPGGLANAVLGSRSLVVHPNGSVLYAASEGGSNVGAFSINPGTGALAVVSYTATGSGASSVVVHPNGTFAYVVLGLSEIGIYSINPATGALTLSGTPVSGGGNIALRLAINAAGTRLYLMNGGVSTLQPSVSAFVVSDAGATLTPLGAPTPAGAAGTFATDIALTP